MLLELIYYCKKCALKLNHNAIVMTGEKIEKIQCMTCKAISVYKEPKAKKETSPKPIVSKKPLFTEEQIIAFSQKNQKPYKMTSKFSMNDVLFHRKFGSGVVTKVEKEKITIKFHEEGIKILVHNQKGDL